MKHIKRFFWAYLLVLAGLWWFTDQTVWAELPHYFAWRSVLMQGTGVLAIGVMSAAMVLAVRPVVFEPWLGGLDKMYRLHKWLGISGLVLSIGHWLLSESAKWLVGLGWLARPERGPRPTLVDEPVRQFFMDQRGLAEGLGEWAFYAAVALMVLALIKRFPYRYFFRTHNLLAVAYLVLVWHTVILLQFDYWSGVLGPVMALLMAAGSIAAVMVLFGRVAVHRQLVGEVAAVRLHPALNVIEVDIGFQGRWAGHEAGQFAFVTLHEKEGAHPYTITSAWADDGRLTFIIKALGDYTRTLADTVKVGDVVKVEGPYGRFNFAGQQPRQIWVGAGIGITPFISRMKALAKASDGKTIDLFHTTAVYDEHAIGLIEADAKAAGVCLHVSWDERDGWLTAARIAEQVPEWRDADFWFCGPAAFGRTLKKDFVALGLDETRFHQELFEMR
ncbi:MAG TPA: ferric reductase [Hydrogenophaga sp.]|uniref:ferredoxin reductase family protein n=1 Tax=Hydrogenophaga sp. TaxID=1904254 RepID=UPI0008C80D8C|nr:ferric reductase-like transmembrane domain-containing protein [Hydrogenophaga sp.]OGA77826.1 MAG: ferric reductase [Burkholderiales bacterium GWE1_65_30]OGA94177.1 MAG: ferric reductase [Burkholderiales bacterium GWF1_66_17]HAX20552.1 ferric reductase [Hydrogenophaga sp.]HBU19242.1 ferric reductase [Hydrogenophaga sp.]